MRLSLHPAGHVLGSAQVRLEHGGQVWVASGDYYVAGDSADPREDNATCAPFEPVRCHCFITESTFGLPIYRWQPQAELFADDRRLVARQRRRRPRQPAPRLRFGKAQRILHGVDRSIGPIVVHGAVEPLNRAYRAAGVDLPETPLVTEVEDKAVVPPRPRRRAAVGAGLDLDAPLRRLQRCLRERLDAAARRAPAPLGRPRLRPQRPRRLARPAARDRRDRRRAGDRHPRLRGGDGALARPSRASRRARSRPSTARTTTSCRTRSAPRSRSPACRRAVARRERRSGRSDRRRRRRRGGRGRRRVKRFARLFAELDASTATLAKVDALKRYFAAAAPRDAAWAVYFLAGGKPRQVVPSGVLWAIACRRAGIDDWLFDACYQAVGDFAETVAHVLPPPAHESDLGLAEWVEERLLPLRGLAPDEQAARVAAYWDELDTPGASCSTS